MSASSQPSNKPGPSAQPEYITTMTTAMTVQQHLARLNEVAKTASPEKRVHGPDSAGHQGDVYVHPIKSRPAAWNVENGEQTRQVAVGQTVGARHFAEGNVRIFWPESSVKAAEQCPIDFFANDAEARGECLGPIIEADDKWCLSHPEHAHHEFPAGTYQITYQLDFATRRRVID